MRAPLWQQRKRSADLLAVASRYGSFPVLLETYRECLRDFFDMSALIATLTDVRSRKIRIVTVDSEKPSPFAASLLFSYVASFLYDGDAPLAERRAQALVGRPSAAARAAGRRGTARAARPRRDGRDRAAVAARSTPDTASSTQTACTTCCWRSAISPRGDRARTVTIEVAGRIDDAGRSAARAAGAHGRRVALRRRRRRRAVPRRARRSAAAGRTRVAAGTGQPIRSAIWRCDFARTHAPFTARRFRGALRTGRYVPRKQCCCG